MSPVLPLAPLRFVLMSSVLLSPGRGLLAALLLALAAPGGSLYAEGPSRDEERAELEALLRTGEYGEALDWYEEEPERFPLLWARLLVEVGRPAEALERIEGAAPFAAGRSDFLTAAGALRHDRGELEAAQALLERAIAAEPKRIEALVRLGEVRESLGDREAARGHWQQVLTIYQQMTSQQVKESPPELFVWMGRACEKLGRIEEAYQVLYSTAFDLDDGNVAAHVASGRLFTSKYNYPDARSHFLDALKTNSRAADAHIGLARAIYADYAYPGERYQDTKMHLELARQTCPDHPEGLMLEGDIAFFDEEWAKVERSYRAAIEQDPSDLWRQGRLAALYFATAQLDRYGEICRSVDEKWAKPAAFYGSLAERLVDRFFYVEAADLAQKAVDIDPEYWPAYVVLGVNALRAGRDEVGREFTQKAFEADPYNVWAFNTLQLIKRIDRKFVEKKDEDFVIRMPEEEEPFLMPYLEPLLHETRERMERAYELEVTRPITVEDFAQHAYFSARSIGLPGLAASGVCFGRMVTLTTPNAIPGNWGAVAVHEFAHVVTLHAAKYRIPRWFGEGLSVFEEGRGNPRWKRIYANDWVTAVAAGRLLPMADIQKGFTRPSFPGQVLLSYYQGGAICDFIEKEWGYDAILRMLEAYAAGKSTEQVFAEVLAIDLPSFDRRFLVHAKELADSFGGLGPRWPEESIDGFRYHTEDHPDDVAGWVRLSWAYFFHKRMADAELAMGTARKLDPDHPDLLALEGMIARDEKKWRTTREKLEAAIAGGTTYGIRCRTALALLEEQEKNAEAAIALWEEIIRMHPLGVVGYLGAPHAYHQLARLLEDVGREAEAVKVLEDLVDIDRDDFPTRMKLADYHAARENWEKVIRCAWDAPFIYPYVRETHRLLGRAYLETGKPELAVREYTVALAGDDPPLRQLYPFLAEAHWKAGNIAEARDYAERARTMTPDDPRVREVLDAVGGGR